MKLIRTAQAAVARTHPFASRSADDADIQIWRLVPAHGATFVVTHDH
jgi:hypothetical protein